MNTIVNFVRFKTIVPGKNEIGFCVLYRLQLPGPFDDFEVHVNQVKITSRSLIHFEVSERPFIFAVIPAFYNLSLGFI